MFELWLMRHGEAVDPDQAGSDFERSLTDTGRRQVAEFAQWICERTSPPERVLHSPLRRARETANMFASETGRDIPVEESAHLSPGMSADRLLQHISRSAAERVLCVGHQPDVGRCLGELIGGGRFEIPPGFCAAIHFRGAMIPGAGSLLWITTPDWFCP